MKINDTEWAKFEAEFLAREREWEKPKHLPMSLGAKIWWLAYVIGLVLAIAWKMWS